MKWTCQLGCTEPIEADTLDEVSDHLRVMHPEQWSEPERWPDGRIVVHDPDAVLVEDFLTDGGPV